MSPIDSFKSTLQGAICKRVVVQAYAYHGELVADVTVVYIQFGPERWARFGIDAGHFHWRETRELEAIAGDGQGNAYPLVDFAPGRSVSGRAIEDVSLTSVSPNVTTLCLSLGDSGAVCLINQGDSSHLEFRLPGGKRA